MPRSCKEVHPTLQPLTCNLCYWCAVRSPMATAYRKAWGEPEPGPEIPNPSPWVRSEADIPNSQRESLTQEEEAPSKTRNASGHDVIVPQPPSLQLRPESRRALVTVAAGKTGQMVLSISRPMMQAYARRMGVDLVILDWPGHPEWPMSCKYGIARVLEHYESIAYVDADVLLKPGCVDLFSACPEGSFCAVDELPWHLLHPQHGIINQYQAFRTKHGFLDTTPPWYLNCGVFVARQQHMSLLLPPEYPLEVHNLSEQHHTNAGLLSSGVLVHTLPQICNWQHWTDIGFKNAPLGAILHFSGMGERERLQLMVRLSRSNKTSNTTTQSKALRGALPNIPFVITPPPAGPGTELKHLLKELGIDIVTNCSCNSRAQEMNKWGVQGCRDRREEIVQWLKEEQDRRRWLSIVGPGIRAVAKGLWINPLDHLGSLVDEAIRRAEVAASSDSADSGNIGSITDTGRATS